MLHVVAAPSNEGLYHAVAIDKCGRRVESRKARLSLGGAVTITQQPVSVAACAGQSVTFSVAATGGNLRYKWRKNGANIPGAAAEGSSFTIPAVSAADAAAYTVVVYNACGPAKESAAATLTVSNGALTLSSPGQSFNASGGAGSAGVTGCGAWTAASDAAWITITGPTSGFGNGTVTYSVTANPTYYLRTGTLTIAGKTFNIMQQPALMTNDSRFIIQNVPVTMVAGQRYTVSVTFRNTGASTWTAANGYKLVSQAPLNNLNWGLNEVPWPSSVASVAPGADVTFSFTATAPATPGRYRFDWRVTQGQSGFGGFTPGLEVTVTP
ncbi:MAG: immunoglobulin domain-containing protein [Blastocatellia bacterium]